MTNLATIPLHELLALAAHKARSHMGEGYADDAGRPPIMFEGIIERAALFAEAQLAGDWRAMKAHADKLCDDTYDLFTEVETIASAREAAAKAEEAAAEEAERINWNREEGFARFPGMVL